MIELLEIRHGDDCISTDILSAAAHFTPQTPHSGCPLH